ncbi:MAG: hypothetical protein V2B20_21755 [Pseudomonadota bacterium]
MKNKIYAVYGASGFGWELTPFPSALQPKLPRKLLDNNFCR